MTTKLNELFAQADAAWSRSSNSHTNELLVCMILKDIGEYDPAKATDRDATIAMVRIKSYYDMLNIDAARREHQQALANGADDEDSIENSREYQGF